MIIIEKILNRIFFLWNPWFREHIINPRNRKRLRNREVTIFCNNCVGAVISHDLGLQFRSPFVNVWLYPNDYLKFCENLQHYLNCNLDFISYNEVDYPVARLDDVTIFFQHYHTEDEAKESWERRKKRIDPQKIYCILVERDGCTKDDLIRFSNLPFPTASLVHIPMEDVRNSTYIRGFEDYGQLGDIIPYRAGHFAGKRYLDDFDYVNFLNTSDVGIYNP